MNTNKIFILISKKTLFFIIQSFIVLSKKERNTSEGTFCSIKVAIVLSLFFLWNLFTERFLNEKNYDCSKKRTKRDFKQHNSWLKIFILSEGSVSSSHCLLIKVIDSLFWHFVLKLLLNTKNKLFICSFIVETASQISFHSVICFLFQYHEKRMHFVGLMRSLFSLVRKKDIFILKRFSLQRKTTIIVLFLPYPFECYEYSIFICVFLFNEQNISFIFL